MRHRLPIVVAVIIVVALSAGCRARMPAPAPTVAAPTSTWAPTRPPTVTPTHTSAPTATATPGAVVSPTPARVTVRAKIEIVWPHGGADVQEADLVNITAYLLSGDGTEGARNRLDSVPCDWTPTVRLWGALNNASVRPLGVGQKRMVTGGGRSFPAWDFNDVDVREARDPANKLSFFVTVDSADEIVGALHNVWVHAADARTLFPQPETPSGVTVVRPNAIDARIQIVWPHDNLPVEQAKRANITAYLFAAGTEQALSPDIAASAGWMPVVRLHMSLNNDPESPPGVGQKGAPRVVTAANGVKFLAWDFNDVDVSAANDPLNRLYFWVTVDGSTTFSDIWAHAADARTLFPQLDVLNSCK